MVKGSVILVGGFCEIVELCDLCNKNIVGIVDKNLQGKFFGYDVLGGDEIAPLLYNEFGDVELVVTPDSPNVRKKLVEYYKSFGFKFCRLISPRSYISKSSKIGEGVVIQDGVNISSMAVVGDYVKVNTLANIMHNSVIGDYSTVAPNAVILGNVRVLASAYIGSNATLLPNISIGCGATVGAGAVVTKNVYNDVTVVGVPAKILKRGSSNG